MYHQASDIDAALCALAGTELLLTHTFPPSFPTYPKFRLSL